MYDETFDSPKSCLARARYHIDDLEVKIGEFFNPKPYSLIREIEAKTGDEILKFKLIKPIPRIFGNIAKDAAINLRDTLDHTGYACALASGNTRLKGTYFPIADTAEKLEADVIGRGRCRDIPEDILDLFRAFQPYEGGNDLIWSLNKLANTKKHRIVVPMCPSIARVQAGGFSIVSGDERPTILFPTLKNGILNWDYAKNEIVLMRLGAGAEVQKYPQFKIAANVALSEPRSLRAQPLAGTLSAMAGEVERILLATEAEARRLGIIA